MTTLVKQQKEDIQLYFFEAFKDQRSSDSQEISRKTSFESSKKYRDAMVWRLLCRERFVDVENLQPYWELMDAMMDISIESASALLENLYEYRVRKLLPLEKRRLYPGVSNDVYRMEYDDEQGGYRDVCAGTLINEAIDLLQAEADRLTRR